MTRIDFNDAWSVREKTSIFAQLGGRGEPAVPVTLPHDALIDQPRSRDGAGKNAHFPGSAAFEYTKSFDVPAEWANKRVSLELDGAYRDAVVFANDVYVGQRPYGYTPFLLALDDHLVAGASNTVRVEVRAHDDSRWYTGAGITRGATLVLHDLLHLAADGVRITTPDVDDERAVVEIAVESVNLSLRARTVTVDVEIVDPADAVVATGSAPVTLRTGGTEVARIRTYISRPQRWSVDSPTLYRVRTRLSDAGDPLDEREDHLGIRTIQLDPAHGLRINGQSVKLRGACIHHDNGPLGAAAFPRAEERRIERLKQAGFNAIRSAHNPISGALLAACDRIGMLVMDETFDVWTDSKSSFDYSLRFADWWERDVQAMVARDFNHPSVIFYSIGNEIPETGSPLGAQVGRRIAEKVRSLDSTRLITNGVNGFVSTLTDVMAMMREHGGGGAAGGVNDAMGSLGQMMNQITASPLVTAKTSESISVLDVAGLNYGDARYEMDRELFPNRLIVGTETFPEHIDVLWDLVMRNSHVIGDFTWTGWDYLGEVGIGRLRYVDEPPAFEAPYPWRTAWCGDIDIIGQRRTISYYRETVFGLRHAPFLAVHRPQHHGRQAVQGGWSWTDSLESWTWSVEAGTPIAVDVYSDAEEIELLLDGAVVGRAPIGRQRAFQASFDLAYHPGELVAVAYAGGAEVGRTSLRSASGPAHLDVRPERGTVDANGGDLAYIPISLRDRSGVLVTDSDVETRVEVTGPGVLQAFSSGRPDSETPFHADTCATHDGRSLVIVRPTAPGRITVTVTADGYETATCTVESLGRDRIPAPLAEAVVADAGSDAL